ncbi:MAG TPA: divalent metal cation transporter [Candidatus Aminicenantes bacterium]|nr:divalent metal cation transporter [Candidatus Aminicenantes bacterium]HRY66202.1 divalent metal cation transporter [Candidatus Aminicenantes bacterium]HRZ73116.1 divalent metal cation transporter [Candidatus Aminicenantes bacterium]
MTGEMPSAGPSLPPDSGPETRRRGIRRGLPMGGARDPEALAAETARLREIDARPGLLRRWKGYWSLSGPGWVQSALTLGAGSAGSSIFAGAVYGYDLLWVQPVAMFLGVVVFAAIGHQALVTQARPYDVFRATLHPVLAYAWAGVVLLASIIWQFPQYALATSVSRDIFDLAGLDMPRLPIALALMAAGTALCWSYGRGSRRAVRLFERVLKYLVLLMSLFFLLVVLKTGVDLKALARGFFGFHVPRDREGLTIVLGALGAAVGVNMTFLYPYTLLARGWGREHRGLKNFDLVVSMFAPFVLTTSLVVIACANTLHVRGIRVREAVDAAHALAPVAGAAAGRVIFSLGILGMCFTTLAIEMVICGFVLSEMLGFEPSGRRYRAATMVANIGILGAFYPVPFWLPVAASSTALIMMPIAYIAFFILQNKRGYLGDDRPRGLKRTAWNALLVVAILVVVVAAAVKIMSLL